MTAVSLSALGLVGCTTRFKLDPARTPDLVNPYTRCRQSIVYYQGTRYPIRPEQAPELRVIARRPSCQPARGELAPAVPGPPEPAPATETFSAPLGDVRAEGDVLYFPNTRAVRTSELAHAELVLPGEPPVPLPSSPKDKPRALSSRNNFIGGQIGGTGYFQAVYRRRIYGPLLLDIGAFIWGPPPLFNGSAGLVLDVPISWTWSVYAGAGVGAGLVIGETEVCPSDTSGNAPASEDDCKVTAGSDSTSFVYGRLGIGYRLGRERRDQIGVNVGFWSGTFSSDVDGDDSPAQHEHILWPMAGLFVMHAL